MKPALAKHLKTRRHKYQRGTSGSTAKNVKCSTPLRKLPVSDGRAPSATHLQHVYLKAYPKVHRSLLCLDEVVELVVEVSADAHVCVHAVELAGELVPARLLRWERGRDDTL